MSSSGSSGEEHGETDSDEVRIAFFCQILLTYMLLWYTKCEGWASHCLFGFLVDCLNQEPGWKFSFLMNLHSLLIKSGISGLFQTNIPKGPSILSSQYHNIDKKDINGSV